MSTTRKHKAATATRVILVAKDIPISTIKKSSAAAKATPTKGVTVARANRSECNTLTNDERAALTNRAMNLIYGSNGPQVPARRR
jgi:hypothetical protein